ncbi:MAG TPA: SRPBCC domain-containing protein [Bacteroidota bacterium]
MPQAHVAGTVELFLQRTIHAPVGTVFRAWTDPESMKGWFAPPDRETALAEVDLRVGGKYRIGFREKGNDAMRVVSGVYREIRAPHRLVFTWCWEDDPEKHETLVTVDLRECAGQTVLKLTHINFQSEDVRDHHKKGWVGCVDSLVRNLQAT